MKYFFILYSLILITWVLFILSSSALFAKDTTEVLSPAYTSSGKFAIGAEWRKLQFDKVEWYNAGLCIHTSQMEPYFMQFDQDLPVDWFGLNSEICTSSSKSKNIRTIESITFQSRVISQERHQKKKTSIRRYIPKGLSFSDTIKVASWSSKVYQTHSGLNGILRVANESNTDSFNIRGNIPSWLSTKAQRQSDIYLPIGIWFSPITDENSSQSYKVYMPTLSWRNAFIEISLGENIHISNLKIIDSNNREINTATHEDILNTNRKILTIANMDGNISSITFDLK